MKSNYERRNFIQKYWLIAGPFLAVSLIILFVIYTEGGSIVKILSVILSICLVLMTVLLFFRSKKDVDKAYISIDKASDMMLNMVEGGNAERLLDLEEGSIGILYNNFGNLVNMFQEAKRREQNEKEYLKDVMSDISHQLKTPLASMEVFIELLLNDKVESVEERRQILEETSNQVNRMEWMVLSMLKLARIDAGTVSFNISDVDLKMVLEEVRRATHYLTDKKNQKLKIICPDDVTVKADIDWLIEALINITKNASDYSDDGDIEIEVEQNNVFTRIYIRDHGIGMTEDTMAHIFDRFYRASNEVNPNSVGIGLSLSKSIIEGMGGRLFVDSKLGEGSCFKVQF